MEKIKIGFIGAGNMGAAIMKGIYASEAGKNIELYAADPSTEKLEELAEYGVTACSDAVEVTEKCGYVFLAVKPQVIEGVLETIAPAVTADKVLVSIAAGISDEFIASIRDAQVRGGDNTFLYGEVWEDASNKIAYNKRKEYYLGAELDGTLD